MDPSQTFMLRHLLSCLETLKSDISLAVPPIAKPKSTASITNKNAVVDGLIIDSIADIQQNRTVDLAKL